MPDQSRARATSCATARRRAGWSDPRTGLKTATPSGPPASACARVHAVRATRRPAIVACGKVGSRNGLAVARPGALRSEKWPEESKPSAARKPRGANRFSRFSAPRSLVAPDAFQMIDAPFQVLHWHARIKLEDFDVLRLHQRFQRAKINHARTGRAMVARRELHVVDVKTRQPVRERTEVHGVMNESEYLFDLRVAGIVPVTNGRAGKFSEEQREITFQRDFLQGFTVFDAQLDAARLGFGGQSLDHFVGQPEVFLLFQFPAVDDFGTELFVFGGLLLAGGDHANQLVSVILHVETAEVQHHQFRIQTTRRLEGFERITPGVLALAGVEGGKPEEVWVGLVHADGQRTEIVKRGNVDVTGIHRFQDARQQADADAVAQFRVFKTKFADFPQHGAAVGVTMRIPAGRKGIHRQDRECFLTRTTLSLEDSIIYKSA